MSKTNAMSLRSLGAVLPKPAARKIYLFAVARVLANLLDIIGLAGIALLATYFSSFPSGVSGPTPMSFPFLGLRTITEIEAVLIALAIAGTFILKSFFAIWINLRSSLFVASLETVFAKQLAEDYFQGGSEGETGFEDSLSEFQNVVFSSTTAFTSFINARISAIAEASLLFAMISAFALVNPTATLAMFAYLGFVLYLLGRVVTKRIRSNGTKHLEGFEASLTSSRDLFGVRREVRANGTLRHWIDTFAKARGQAASSGALVYTLNSLPRYVIETSLILGIFTFLAAIVVFSDLPSQAVTIGVFMAGGLRLVASMLPLQAAINSMIDGANRGQPAFERLLAISARPAKTVRDQTNLEHGKPLSVTLESVSFGFAKGAPVIKDISFEINAGSKVAIVGPSGAGKTTCFELATGFRLPTDGTVLVGGQDPRVLLENGQGVIGIVPQRPYLITGSLAENISLDGSSQTDQEKVIDCLKLAGLKSFANRQALAMKIVPDAGQLSGGEIQRLGIARALYRNPGILFLDEATSALDAETESEISKVLDTLRGNMTIVLIAHRLSTVMNSDKIIYLDKGRVVAQGTFCELKSRVPDFAKAVELMEMRSERTQL